MLQVLADQNLYQLEQFVPSTIQLDTCDPSDGLPGHWNRYDALLIRTVTNISEDLFDGIDKCSVKFIGSGSAGFDHVDLPALEERNIRFTYAPGCNARSVAEYVATTLLMWSEQRDTSLNNQVVGIVGVGNVGATLAELLNQLDIPLNLYDPPRQQRDHSFISCSLEQLLSSDILTFHTPLNREGDYPTYHWLDADKLKHNEYKLVLNTARGGVIDEEALYEAFTQNKINDYILDVWEDEPRFDDQIARNALFRTPHIAGYSHQAKLRASHMICADMADHFNLPAPPAVSSISNDSSAEQISEDSDSLSDVLKDLHPLKKYQKALDQLIGLPDKKKGKEFARIRTGRHYRQEYPYISLREDLLEEFPLLKALGIQQR